MSNVINHNVVCFGEVLWDVLPSGSVPGGAPMNVAYHLHKLQKYPAVITRVGNDANGEELVKVFSDYGVCTDFFQVGSEHETGKVYAEFSKDNEVLYDIVKPVAWDHIMWEDRYQDLVSTADFFVFGSLAARSYQSKSTLFRLLESANNNVLDINLREPHFNQKIIEELLLKADFLKLNFNELQLISGWFSDHIKLEDRVNSIRDKFDIPKIVVTKGGDGALLFYDDQLYVQSGCQVEVVDTVGSGDAFLAGLLAKLQDGVELVSALQFASALGAFIATKNGACPEYNVSEIQQLAY